MLRTVTAAGIAALSLVTSSQVMAQVACGDVITENTALTGNLSCDTNPALTVEGPAVLDLAGFTVSCEDDDDYGIRLLGEFPVLINGTVRNCRDGVRVDTPGESLSVVSQVIAEQNKRFGFHVRAVNVYLVNNEARDNFNDGFHVFGDSSVVVDNISEKNGDDGVWLNGIGSFVVRNTLNENLGEGLKVISISPGTTITANTVTANAAEGIEIRSDKNEITANTVEDNGDSGILLVTGAERNTVRGNVAFDNEEFDLRDANENCDRNDWSGNEFGTARPASCIE